MPESHKRFWFWSGVQQETANISEHTMMLARIAECTRSGQMGDRLEGILAHIFAWGLEKYFAQLAKAGNAELFL